MKRIGSLPTIFGKYNLSRYGSSHDAEYKSAYADEYALSQGFPRTFGNVSCTWYIVSNQGLIGLPGRVFYEEDFRANAYEDLPDTKARGQLAFHGGYASLLMTDKGSVGRGFYLGTGNSVAANVLTTENTTSDTTTGHWQDVYLGPTAFWGTWDESIVTYDYSGAVGQTQHHYIKGKRVGTLGFNPSGGWNAHFLGYDSAVARASDPSLANAIMTPAESIYYAYTASTQRPAWTITGQGNELCVYFMGQVYGNLLSMETGKFVMTNVEAGGGVTVSIAGRYFMQVWHTTSNPGVPHKLYYYDPTTNELTTVEFDREEAGNDPDWQINAVTGACANALACVNYWRKSGEGAGRFDLYYKGKLIRKNMTALPATFGTCMIDVDSHTMTDVETDETRDFSDVVPEAGITSLPGGRSAYLSSGLYGRFAVKRVETEESTGVSRVYDLYIIGWDRIFKVTVPDSRWFFTPNQNHASTIYCVIDQVLYVITAEECRAYDCQTLMRLDDLPGFDGAVSLLKDFTK